MEYPSHDFKDENALARGVSLVAARLTDASIRTFIIWLVAGAGITPALIG